ncbi:MAG: Uma2 family endonuclease [Prosthecobacter sp.]|uniref:Uma2 family endonuclease n=1 Tax=Prosthecobacter sp. TaxID=1965333 RepID=UPI003903139B
MSTAVLAAPAPDPSSIQQEDVAALYLQERGKPMPGKNHAIVQLNLGVAFAQHRDFRTMSELNLELDGWRVVPDLCVFPRSSNNFDADIAWVTTVPLIAVEIISPSQTLEEMTAKINKLLAAGVPSVWFIIPSVRVISIYQKGAPLLSATAGVLTDPVTGISVNVDEIFA